MIDEAHTGTESEGKSDDHPIALGGFSAFEMACFLDALETPFVFGDPQLSFEQWAAALHLATMWSFDDLRNSIISQVDKITEKATTFDLLDVSLKCRVEKWLHPAYEALCRRKDSFTDDEVERLGLKRAAAIWRIRETLGFERTPEIPPSSPCCSKKVICWNCERDVFQRQPSRDNGDKKGPPEPPPNRVLELIQREDALRFP
ncbi:hypothetical protein FRC04_008418 [Tulasnella sp. 424]|nr:hypothetical protein FRC04_008418 [Tulasnella sp. 424]KAG8976789.1 hypothetical protein FRC05_003139 [Tulasnella sp. 425]